jgi:translation initiation factor RLI1
LQPADIYLIDEPSAYLDSEQRIVAAKVIKRFILHAKKTAFVVEHDFIMATYLADKVIVYEGKPSIDCTANSPQSLVSGMNRFLSVSVSIMFVGVCCFSLFEYLSLLFRDA